MAHTKPEFQVSVAIITNNKGVISQMIPKHGVKQVMSWIALVNSLPYLKQTYNLHVPIISAADSLYIF